MSGSSEKMNKPINEAQISFVNWRGITKVVSDILNCTNYGNSEQYIIFDDYGHPKTGVKKAIQDTINQNDNFNIVEYIGEPKGSDCRPGLILTDYEGVVCKFLKTETEPQWWEEK